MPHFWSLKFVFFFASIPAAQVHVQTDSILNHAIKEKNRKQQNDDDEKCYYLFLDNYQIKNHNSLY